MAKTIWVYFHGFLSSPRSLKAQQVVHFLENRPTLIECRVPEIPEEPQRASAVIDAAMQQALADSPDVAVLGSSLGGFYATVAAARYGLRAVLINPAVRPHTRMQAYMRDNAGALTNPYTGRRFALDANDVEVLRAMQPQSLAQPQNYWLLAQTGDEVLDYREAVDFYAGCKQTIEAGGDHAFQKFERHLPDIVKFLQSPTG